MLFSDLGPLEQAILEAVVEAEARGLPLDTPTLWRLLRGYRTHRNNIESALVDDSPLRRWLLASGPFYVLRDRADSAVGVSAGRRRAQTAWEERSGLIRGLSKLPWVEAVAAVGPFALGFLPSIADPIDLVVIAEGGRVDLARKALGAFRRARRGGSNALRILVVLDADRLGLAEPGRLEAGLWAGLQPVVNEGAWAEFRASNPWLETHYPNWQPSDASFPTLVSDRRLDGRLARVRRQRLTDDEEDSLLRSERRRGGLLGKLEERAARRFSVGASDPGILATLPAGAREDYEQRLDGIRSWSFDEEAEPIEEDDPVIESATPVEADAPVIESATPVEEEPELSVVEEPAEESSEAADPPVEAALNSGGERTSRRSRGPRRRPARTRRSSASTVEGQGQKGTGRRGSSRRRSQ